MFIECETNNEIVTLTNSIHQYEDSSNTDLPSGKSCLLAKTSIMASFISLSSIILLSSLLASSILSLSAQSTTKIRPCVPAK